MEYGQDKIRTMVRSILPSKNRRPARCARVVAHRAARGANRRRVHDLLADPEEADALCFDKSDREIASMVRWRRGGDKVAPLLRWAAARTRHLPRDSRLSKLRSLVPDNLIGQHALLHAKFHADLRPTDEQERHERYRLHYARSRKPDLRDRSVRFLRACVEDSALHRALNRAIRTAHREQANILVNRSWKGGFGYEEALRLHCTGPRGPRLFLGAHDVEPFLADLDKPQRARWPFDLLWLRSMEAQRDQWFAGAPKR